MIRKFKDVTYFMVSVDTLEDNKAFAQKEQADFPLLADPDKKVAAAYGVIPEGKQYASRWTFYIGPDGKILFVDKQVHPATSGEDIVAKLKDLGIAQQ
jgi:thioredoxin-dependent peroxiredoxin